MDREYKAVILESDELDSPTKITKEITRDFDKIILPLYRGLIRFWSQSFSEPHWDELYTDRKNELTELIKNRT